jgi:plastocyanin
MASEMHVRPPVLVVLVVLVAGCGGDGARRAATPRAPADAVVSVAIRDIEFVPRRVTARVGQTVRWTNQDGVAHTVAANTGADFSSDALDRGDTFELRVTATGAIPYFCTIHAGQTGTLVVR